MPAARSFFVQLLAEAAALRVRRSLGWRPEAVLLCGAGKFALRGSWPARQTDCWRPSSRRSTTGCAAETSGELRLTLAWADAAESHRAAYQAAQHELLRRKAQPWAPAPGAAWADSRLILDPLDTPCNSVPPRTRNRRRD